MYCGRHFGGIDGAKILSQCQLNCVILFFFFFFFLVESTRRHRVDLRLVNLPYVSIGSRMGVYIRLPYVQAYIYNTIEALHAQTRVEIHIHIYTCIPIYVYAADSTPLRRVRRSAKLNLLVVGPGKRLLSRSHGEHGHRCWMPGPLGGSAVDTQ